MNALSGNSKLAAPSHSQFCRPPEMSSFERQQFRSTMHSGQDTVNPPATSGPATTSHFSLYRRKTRLVARTKLGGSIAQISVVKGMWTKKIAKLARRVRGPTRHALKSVEQVSSALSCRPLTPANAERHHLRCRNPAQSPGKR